MNKSLLYILLRLLAEEAAEQRQEGDDNSRRLDRIEQQQEQILKEIQIMSAEVTKLIAAFDVATTAIADRIQRLSEAFHLSVEDQAALQAEVDKLTALGKDPANPIPGA